MWIKGEHFATQGVIVEHQRLLNQPHWVTFIN